MTTPNRAELAAAAQRLGRDLRRAQRDVALLQRLKTAEAEAKRISAELEKVQAELEKIVTADVQAKRAQRYAAFKELTVTESRGDSPLWHKYTISLTRLTYNGYASVPTQAVYEGFGVVPADVFGYLLEVHPEKVPASILALCPDDPWEAFNRYFRALKRGYLTEPVAA